MCHTAFQALPYVTATGLRHGSSQYSRFPRCDSRGMALACVRVRVCVLRACFSPLRRAWERAKRNEAARGHWFRSYAKKRVWVHAESWASPVESVRTVCFAHATTPTRCCAQTGVHVQLRHALIAGIQLIMARFFKHRPWDLLSGSIFLIFLSGSVWFGVYY